MSLVQHLEKIAVFAVVAESGSLGAASRRLAVSQPALSQSLKTLESVVGCQLLTRSREGVELTAPGRLMYQSVVRILKEVGALEAALTGRDLLLERSLRLGIIDSIAIYAWPRAQENLRALFAANNQPETHYRLSTGRSVELLRHLAAADVDVAIVIDPAENPLFVREPLFQDSFFLYGAPNDPGRKALEKVTDASARRQVVQVERPLFLFESARVSSGLSLRDAYQKSKLNFSNVNVVDSFEVASEFVRAGLGYSLLPERVARRSGSDLHKVKIFGKVQEPLATHAIYACAPQTVATGTAFKLLCQAMRSP